MSEVSRSEVKDYSGVLVNKTASEKPYILPVRFFTGEHTSRYCYSCSLADIEAAGFLGPYEQPSVTETEKLVWNPDNSTYSVVSKDAADYIDPINDSAQATQFIKIQLGSLPDITNETKYDAEYRLAWGAYEHKLINLLNKAESGQLISSSDLPDLPVNYEKEEDNSAAYAQQVIDSNIDRWKTQWETYGAIFSIHPDVRPYFTLPSDWVAGNQPFPDDTSSYLGPNSLQADA